MPSNRRPARRAPAATEARPAPPAACAPIIAAIDALLAGGLNDDATALLERHGALLLRSGCAAIIESWKPLAPPPRATPAALLLSARVMAERDPAAALPAFRAALAACRDAGETYLAIQAAASLALHVYTVWGDFRPLDESLPVAARALEPDVAHPDRTSELECLTGLMSGWLLVEPNAPRLATLADRMFDLASDPGVHPAVRLRAGGVLLGVCQLWNELDRARALIRLLDGVAAHADVPPASRRAWVYEASLLMCLLQEVSRADAEASVARFADTLPEAPARLDAYRLARLRFEAAFRLGDAEIAEAALAAMREAMDAGLPVQAITVAAREAMLARMRRQYRRAIEAGERAADRAAQIGVPPLIAAVYRFHVAVAQLQLGEFADARASAAMMVRDGAALHRRVYENVGLAADALAALATLAAMDMSADAATSGAAAKAANDAIAEYLAALEHSGQTHLRVLERDLLGRVLVHALRNGIAPAFVPRLIAEAQVPPPPDAPESWPWAARIRVLGRPVVSLDGVPLRGKSKGQQRPLELLYAIALGGGGTDTGADATAVMNMLWTDADADAKASFDMTLMRLRKLLEHDGLIALTDGRLRLDRSRIWCDAWEFGAALERGVEDSDVLGLYTGPALGDTPPAWAASVRERLRNAFLQAVATRAGAAETRGEWDAAIALYERALEQDNLAEDFYRGLMRCHLAQGANANALRVYRRCRDLLSIVLGVKPTAATEALYRGIAGA